MRLARYSLAEKQYLLKQIVQRLTPPKLWAPSLNLDLFEQQRKFKEDQSRFKAALCSRRAGKSHVCAAMLVETCAQYANVNTAYIALTRDSAKRIIWKVLKRVIRDNNLTARYSESELTVTFPNGSTISLHGANSRADIETLRGPNYKLVVIDECASFKPYLKELVEEILEPACADVDGTIALIGTPNAACRGYFHDVTTGKIPGYSIHHWTLLDNPFFLNAAEWLKKRIALKGWAPDNPIYLREWCGRWIRSDDSLVYKFLRERNTFKTTDVACDHVLGLDYGWNDRMSFSVIGIGGSKCYIKSCTGDSKMFVDDIAEKIFELADKYGGFIRIVGDPGGGGRPIYEELKKRFGIIVHTAEKIEKAANIDIMNADFIEGNLLVQEDQIEYIGELEILQWDENHLQKQRRIEDARYPNDLCDASLYAYRECRHYLHQEEEAQPKPGTPEHTKMLEELMQAKVIEEQIRQSRQMLEH